MNQATYNLIAAWANIFCSALFLLIGEPVFAGFFLVLAIVWWLMMYGDERKH